MLKKQSFPICLLLSLWTQGKQPEKIQALKYIVLFFIIFIVLQYKQIAPFIDPFLPGFLLKDFIKRKNRSIKDKGKIENSLEGLYHYLSAPNIRFKVKKKNILKYLSRL